MSMRTKSVLHLWRTWTHDAGLSFKTRKHRADESICISRGNSGTTDNDLMTGTLLIGGKLAYTPF